MFLNRSDLSRKPSCPARKWVSNGWALRDWSSLFKIRNSNSLRTWTSLTGPIKTELPATFQKLPTTYCTKSSTKGIFKPNKIKGSQKYQQKWSRSPCLSLWHSISPVLQIKLKLIQTPKANNFRKAKTRHSSCTKKHLRRPSRSGDHLNELI